MIIYQLLPRNLGKGKFSELDDTYFDYLKSLSVTHLWLTGIPRHASDEPFVKGNLGSPYAISNYYDTNPYLADNPDKRMDEFRGIISRAHSKGVKIIIDFIPNHVARNYSDNNGGIPLLDRCDYDWTDTLKIDYSHAETWRKILEIIRFWAAMGVDGFRCDMVELVSTDFFGWLISSAKSEFGKDILFIGEAYDRNNYRRYIDVGKFDYLYDKSGMYDILRGIYAGTRSARELTWNWQSLGNIQAKMLNFLENHDEQRLASAFFAGSAANGYAALAVSALFSISPFMLYYGEELGECAPESSDGRSSIFDRIHPATTGHLCNGLAAIRSGSQTDIIATLQPEEAETLERYRNVLRLASACTDTNYDLCYCSEGLAGFDAKRHFAFLRSGNAGTWLIVSNFSGIDAEIPVCIPAHAVEFLGISGECKAGEMKIAVKSKDFTAIRLC